MPNWHDVWLEIQSTQMAGVQQAQATLTLVRRKYLQQLHQKTGRNIIAYYSGWLSKPGIQLSEINDEDKNGFMTTVHRMDRTLGLDLIIHTPGGGIAATQSIVTYLQKLFGRNIRAIVPQIAMSAGTIIACCCKEVLMGEESNLGPIDPHLRSIPAHGVVREFKRALREVKKDSSRIVIWKEIIGQYRPTFLGQCENAIKWSNDFVEQQLATGMFAGNADGAKKARSITKALSNYAVNKSHERHFDVDECEKMGLVVTRLESDEDLQDKVLTVHHCYMHLLMNSPVFKIIENQNGVGIVKNVPQPPQGVGASTQQAVDQTI